MYRFAEFKIQNAKPYWLSLSSLLKGDAVDGIEGLCSVNIKYVGWHKLG